MVLKNELIFSFEEVYLKTFVIWGGRKYSESMFENDVEKCL